MWLRQDSIATTGEKARKDKFNIARSRWGIRSSGMSQHMLMYSWVWNRDAQRIQWWGRLKLRHRCRIHSMMVRITPGGTYARRSQRRRAIETSPLNRVARDAKVGFTNFSLRSSSWDFEGSRSESRNRIEPSKQCRTRGGGSNLQPHQTRNYECECVYASFVRF